MSWWAQLVDLKMWAALLSLTVLEVILSLDNLLFLSMFVKAAPQQHQATLRRLGFLFAFFGRLGLLGAFLLGLTWTEPLFILWEHPVSIRNGLLIGGGCFLLWKGSSELFYLTESTVPSSPARRSRSVRALLLQLVLVDLVFSLDSVMTAVGMTSQFPVMAIAIFCSMLGLFWSSQRLSRLLELHPSLNVLALAFVMLIGVLLLADGAGFHLPREYLYIAMGIAALVEGCLLLKRQLFSKSSSS